MPRDGAVIFSDLIEQARRLTGFWWRKPSNFFHGS
jgi:hypothetical protein